MTVDACTHPITVLVADDRMQATVRCVPSASRGTLTADSVTQALAEAGIVITDDVNRRIEAFLKHNRSTAVDGRDFIIAQGRKPEIGRDGTVEWAVQDNSVSSSEADKDFDKHAISSFMFVAKGAPIGKVVQPSQPMNGCDIFGTTIPVTKISTGRPVELGRNVAMAADGVTIVAGATGKVSFEDQRFNIEDVMEISGDVDASTGNVDVVTNVVAHGSIRDGMKVCSTHSLLVRGTIESATVEVGGDVVVHGGIITREHGGVVTKGTLVARFCHNACLKAGGDVRLISECFNARIDLQRRLILERGVMVGGELRARQGVVVGTLGCDAATPTHVHIGSMLDLLRKKQEVEQENAKRQRRVAAIRTNVVPLLAGGKRLLPKQREQATELMFEADALDIEIRECDEGVQQEIEAYKETMTAALAGNEVGPSIIIRDRIWPGVQLRLDDLMTTTEQCVDGPIRIQALESNGIRRLCAINLHTGQMTELKTECIKLDLADVSGARRP